MDAQEQIIRVGDIAKRLKEGNVGAGYVGGLTSIVLAAQQPNLKVRVSDVNKELIQKCLNFIMDRDIRFSNLTWQNSILKQGLRIRTLNFNYVCYGLYIFEFTDDVNTAIRESDVIFICVNTPPKKDSKYDMGKESDMTYFDLACQTIAKNGDPANHKILIEKSRYCAPWYSQKDQRHNLSLNLEDPEACYTIVSMPEFHNLIYQGSSNFQLAPA